VSPLFAAICRKLGVEKGKKRDVLMHEGVRQGCAIFELSWSWPIFVCPTSLGFLGLFVSMLCRIGLPER